MSDYVIDGELLTDIADAIREKTGESGVIIPEDMPDEIRSISGAKVLPSGYTKIRGVSGNISTSGAYINTGIIPDSNTTFEILCNIGDVDFLNGDNYLGIMGVRTSSGNKEYTLRSNYTSYKIDSKMRLVGCDLYFRYNSSLNTIVKYDYKNRDNIKMDAQEIHGIFANFDGVNAKYFNDSVVVTSESYACEYPLFLFAENHAGTPNLFTPLTIYALKIKQSGVNVRDYVPCIRNSDNVVGLYDLVNDVFYANSGTGSLVAVL